MKGISLSRLTGAAPRQPQAPLHPTQKGQPEHWGPCPAQTCDRLLTPAEHAAPCTPATPPLQSAGQSPWDTPTRTRPSPAPAGSSSPALPGRGAIPRDGGCHKALGQHCALLHCGSPPAEPSAWGSSPGSPEACPPQGCRCSVQGLGWMPACARRTTHRGLPPLCQEAVAVLFTQHWHPADPQLHGTGCFEAGSSPGKEQALIATRPLGSKTLTLLCSAAAAPTNQGHAQPSSSLPPQG